MQEKESSVSTINQYLTFRLRDDVYGLDIHKVREVLDFKGLTRVPQMPDFMRGVINLRGSVVPVIDLNARFSASLTEKTINTCIIIVEIGSEKELCYFGVLVDAVEEVLDLAADAIEPPPRLGTQVDTAFILGMGKKDEALVILLDIDALFSADELSTVQSATHT